jgi:hypothetical protein
MAKSMRSKWRKKMKAEKARIEMPKKNQRIEKLNGKLDLVVKGGLSKVPMQEGRGVFYFTPPTLDPSKRLVLPQFTTNVHKGLRGSEGNAHGPGPSVHPQAANPRSPKLKPLPAPTRDEDDVFAPAGGHGVNGKEKLDPETKYKVAASSMASDFVPTLDMVVGKRARNANKVRAEEAAAAAAEADSDDDAPDNSGPAVMRLPSAADKRRSGSSKLKETAAKKRSVPAAKRR